MKFILGYKKEMVQYFLPNGKCESATVIVAGPVFVTQIKNKEKDKYNALQVGFQDQKPHRLSKPLLGHLKGKSFKVLKEFRIDDVSNFKVGDKIDLSSFKEGDLVSISGISKAKGFQGVVKRHGFAGGPRTHGQKHCERKPGSIGGGLRTRVPKGMRMAGRMGGERITIKNLKVLAVDPENNILIVKGSVPGGRGSLLEIKGN